MVEPGSRTPFQQPVIGVEKQAEFAHLQSALDRVLREKLLEQADRGLGKSGRSAQQWYDALSVGDQAQVREFYLTALEAVDLPLREKFKQLYRYY